MRRGGETRKLCSTPRRSCRTPFYLECVISYENDYLICSESVYIDREMERDRMMTGLCTAHLLRIQLLPLILFQDLFIIILYILSKYNSIVNSDLI